MILDRICSQKKIEVAQRKSLAPLNQAIEMAKAATAPRDFAGALSKPGISLVAEIKRHSPSRGKLMDCDDPLPLGRLYEQEGASAISVLTDSEFFHGTLEDLERVRAGLSLPCLRKDFVIDEYQIHEARAHRADAVLLIARILSDGQMRDYAQLAREWGMGVLTETHSAGEIERAVNAGAKIIGINNRDLDTFDTDLNTTLELRKLIPEGCTVVSESGIHTRDDVRKLEDAGVDAILVGEALVTSGDICKKIRELLGHES
ncbi:MAG: indole-3-glycerol phosphate synthase TrpC [Candidatus Hydrogenedentes bacterium]|nr:indole-3-glycerol phosphate synthase TrpC [Candidatus Hydrogenedentota bacterium]